MILNSFQGAFGCLFQADDLRHKDKPKSQLRLSCSFRCIRNPTDVTHCKSTIRNERILNVLAFATIRVLSTNWPVPHSEGFPWINIIPRLQ